LTLSRFVSDTHALVWYLSGSTLVSERARAAFDQAMRGEAELYVPAIVIAELVMLVEKRRVNVNMEQILQALRNVSAVRLTPLTSDIALGIQTLTTFDDIHDRLIVAETLSLNAALITRDEKITRSGLVPTIW